MYFYFAFAERERTKQKDYLKKKSETWHKFLNFYGAKQIRIHFTHRICKKKERKKKQEDETNIVWSSHDLVLK